MGVDVGVADVVAEVADVTKVDECSPLPLAELLVGRACRYLGRGGVLGPAADGPGRLLCVVGVICGGSRGCWCCCWWKNISVGILVNM